MIRRMEFIGDNKVKLRRELSELDKFVIEAIDFIKNTFKYIIVSGYVTILFGRPRGTEDIDIIVEHVDKPRFEVFYRAMKNAGFWCLNAESLDNVYEYIEDSTPIRLAREGKVFPNIELQVANSNLQKVVLNDPLIVEMGGTEIKISRIEFQILYKKMVLQGNKDIEDAEYLEHIFKDKLDEQKFTRFKKILKDFGYHD